MTDTRNSFAFDWRHAAMPRITVTREMLGLPPIVSPMVGDKVEVVVTGYVSHVDDDGTIGLAPTRDAFPDDDAPLGWYLPDESTTLRVIERAPKAPKVGDVIDGATVKATPWRRGTIIRCTGYALVNPVGLVLMGDGTWRRLNDDADPTPVPFDHLRNDAMFRVENAPGKRSN